MHSGSVLESELDALESDRPFGNHLALFRECKLHFSRKFAPRVVMAILGGYALCMRRENVQQPPSSSSSFADTHAQCLPPLLLECDRERE